MLISDWSSDVCSSDLQIEGLPDDRLVKAQMQHSRHRDHAVQGRHDAIFAIDPMSRRQQFTGRFLPHDIAADRGPDQVGRVGLPTLELLHLDSLAEARNLVSKIRGESGYIEAVVVRNRSEEHTSELQ